MIKRLLFVLLILIGASTGAFATHIRGGEITFERVPNSQLAVRCTLNIYIDVVNSQVRDNTNDLYFGDGTFQNSPVALKTPLPGKGTEIWTYYYQHTYSAFGIYTMYHWKNFRNTTVNNIGPTPDQVNFYIETQLTLIPQLDIFGPNHSPKLDKPAVDLAKLGRKYFYNPAAYDLDGDSLSYQIIPSRNFAVNVGTIPIQDYQLPHVYAAGRDSAGLNPASLTIDPRTGTMTWDVPNRVGEYNVAIKIIEHRYGQPIGYVVRDMQILVKDVPNKPPYLILPLDTCVEARTTLRKEIKARDGDSLDLLTITANGGVFRLPPPSRPATFDFPRNSEGMPIPQRQTALGLFNWETVCEDVSEQPYVTVFTAEDNKPRDIQLADVKSWTIRVIGPKPIIHRATALPGSSIRVSWAPYICPNIARFQVFRKQDRGPEYDSCKTGIQGDGYTLIGTALPADTSFLDNNNGQGLKFGIVYCYRIVAQFPDPKGGESRPSDEVCARLKITVPLITNVSVERTDSLNGKMFVKWTRPFELDSILIDTGGPAMLYQYIVKRRPIDGSAPPTVVYNAGSISDTSFVDTGFNTKQRLYEYQVTFQANDRPNGRDSSLPAQNINLQGRGTKTAVVLNWSAAVPWNNAGFYHLVYKFNDDTYDLLDSLVGSATTTYLDDGSKIPFMGPDEKKSGRYYVVTRGAYSEDIYIDTLVNKSFEIQVFLADSIPPCPPTEIQIQNANLSCPTCEEYRAMSERANRLAWKAPVDTCLKDLAAYNIYYKPHPGDPFQRIATTLDTFFVHQNNGNMAGCYKVTTADAAGNESPILDSVCNDNCVYFDLPNIFTPNGDSANQKFTPICATVDLIEDASIQVYNRWGVKVFSGGKEALTNWDGRNKIDGLPLPEGTYFYRADVRFLRLNTNEHRNFKGWVEIVR